MKKFLAVFALIVFLFCMINVSSVQAKKDSKSGAGITPEQVTAMNTQLNTLLQKIYEASLFSPEENSKMLDIKLKLDDQMLVSPDPSFAPLYYKLGNLLKARGYKDDAVECYQTILENFSDTALAPKAAATLKLMGVSIKAAGATGGASDASGGM